MERIISRVKRQSPEDALRADPLREIDLFVSSIKDLPFREAEQAISEHNFRKPIVIFGLAIRPFWRDGRKAPPLFPKKIYKGAKAEEQIIAASEHHPGSH